MKRFLYLMICLACILFLTGCSSSNLESVSFFYCRDPANYQYFEEDGVIASEERDLTGHHKDLQYLISLYLAGPLEEGLISPFPRNVRLVEAKTLNSKVYIELSDLGNSMSDSEFSLASVCLAKTCMPFSETNAVTIKSGARTITINMNNILLIDNAIPETTEGGKQ